ncbi:MAG: TauD/TfdA dioxygenase family protein [Gammaproteobacteria bacterium]
MRFDLSGYRHLHVEPAAGSLGAEIGGVDVSRPIGPEVQAEIRRAFLAHKVLFFRGQTLDPTTLGQFSHLFGEPTIPPQAVPLPGHPYVSRIVREANVPSTVRNVGDRWHSDQSPRAEPSLTFLLYCVEAPDYGGDTMFTSLAAAYAALPEDLRARCDGLTVIHSASGVFGKSDGSPGKDNRPLFHAGIAADAAARERTQAILDVETEHPLVRVLPETGERCLYVTGDYCVRIKGMDAEESAQLLKRLHAHATRPEFTCRLRWRSGTLAVLDNRCTMHYAINDYAGFRREMLRTETGGERPMSIADYARLDGRPASRLRMPEGA